MSSLIVIIGVLTALIGTPPHSDATARAIAFYEGGCSVLVSYLETREMYAPSPFPVLLFN